MKWDTPLFLTNKSSPNRYNEPRNIEEVKDVLYEIYIDSLFLINFAMNLYLLTLAGKSTKRTATRFRLMITSFIGSLLFCLLLFVPGILAIGKTFIGPLVINGIMIAFLYKLKQLDKILWCMGYMCAYAFFLGGLMKFLFARFSLLRRQQESIWTILLIAYIGYMILSYGIEIFIKKRETRIVEVCLCCEGKTIRIKALIDTGNSLIDPISKKPVSVTEAAVFENVKEMLIPEKIRVIPYHSVGKANGILEGYEIPELIIIEENEKIRWQKAIVAISKNKISISGAYQMILHPSLLEPKE